MASLTPTTALGGTIPFDETIGGNRIREVSDAAMASLAMLKGKGATFKKAAASRLGELPAPGHAGGTKQTNTIWMGPDQYLVEGIDAAPLAEVESHWDRLIMGCDVTLDGEQVVYQEGELALLMSPAELMALVKEKVNGSLDGAVIYSGTVKMETEEFVFADRFEGRLEDPVLGRAISFGYDIRPIPALG